MMMIQQRVEVFALVRHCVESLIKRMLSLILDSVISKRLNLRGLAAEVFAKFGSEP